MQPSSGREDVLSALDSQRTSCFHFKTIVIAGMGFFTDAYDLFCIGLLTKTLGRIYFQKPPSELNPRWNQTLPTDITANPRFLPCSLTYADEKTPTGPVLRACPKPGALPIQVDAAVSGVALCGTLAGQLIWGLLGDVYGRKAVYGYTLITMIVCAIGQSLSFGRTPSAVIGTLCVFRFCLGFGIGGDYPLSATIMSEYSSTRNRGAFIAAVFATQGFGYLVAASVTLLVVAAAMRVVPGRGYDGRDPFASTPPIADFVWRAVLAFGAVPAALTLYWRAMLPETARFTALVRGDAVQTATDMGRVLERTFDPETAVPVIEPAVRARRSFWRYMRQAPRGMRWPSGVMLFGCAASWFVLDIAFYSQNLFQKDVFTSVGWLPKATSMSALEESFAVARAQALIALGSTVPGYWATVATIDYIGRWPIQVGGFFMMTLGMIVLALDYADLVQHHVNGFLVLYALTFFFANWGPNSTTFIIPAELFAARFRSTCHGIASASGKAGAILGAFGFVFVAMPPPGAIDYARCGLEATASRPCTVANFPHEPDPGYPHGLGLPVALGILAATNGLGLLSSLLVPETRNRRLEELSGEDDEESMRGMAPPPEAREAPTTSNGHECDGES